MYTIKNTKKKTQNENQIKRNNFSNSTCPPDQNITAKLLSDDEEKRRDKYGYYNINI